jgi:molybdopterin converting factor small subunit
MVSVVLPSLLAAQAGGRKRFDVDAPTVETALRTLPVADLIFDESGALRPLVNVYLDGSDVRSMDGLATPVSGGQTVRVVAAVAGG